MAARYDQQALGKYRTAYEETIKISKKYLKPTDRLLDFACGTGIATIELAGSVQQVMAIDLSDEMVRIAEEKALGRGIDNIAFKTATLEDDGLLKNSFDVITAFNILHGLQDPGTALARIGTLLKTGGLFLSVTDCLGEKITATSLLYRCLAKMDFIPAVNFVKKAELIKMITAHGFVVMEQKNLYPSPPNYYIAARKNGV